MRCLITGVTGFVGGHLASALLDAGCQVVGVARRAAEAPVPVIPVDLCDAGAVEPILRDLRPDWVFHLAGYAHTGRSFQDPESAWAGNLTATRSLYSGVVAARVRPRILYVSSGLVYGDAHPGDPPFSETSPLQPASPYAASKAAADILSYQQTRHPGLDIVRVRPFNQIGPGHSAEYAAANFAKQIAEIEAGRRAPVVTTGQLVSQRDLTDVRDMVRAYIRLLEVGGTGEVYNAGSSRTCSMREVLDRLIKLSRVKIAVEEKVDATRIWDTAVSRADTTKLRSETGWEPRYTLDDTLWDLLADWRGRTSEGDQVTIRTAS